MMLSKVGVPVYWLVDVFTGKQLQSLQFLFLIFISDTHEQNSISSIKPATRGKFDVWKPSLRPWRLSHNLPSRVRGCTCTLWPPKTLWFGAVSCPLQALIGSRHPWKNLDTNKRLVQSFQEQSESRWPIVSCLSVVFFRDQFYHQSSSYLSWTIYLESWSVIALAPLFMAPMPVPLLMLMTYAQ